MCVGGGGGQEEWVGRADRFFEGMEERIVSGRRVLCEHYTPAVVERRDRNDGSD